MTTIQKTRFAVLAACLFLWASSPPSASAAVPDGIQIEPSGFFAAGEFTGAFAISGMPSQSFKVIPGGTTSEFYVTHQPGSSSVRNVVLERTLRANSQWLAWFNAFANGQNTSDVDFAFKAFSGGAEVVRATAIDCLPRRYELLVAPDGTPKERLTLFYERVDPQ